MRTLLLITFCLVAVATAMPFVKRSNLWDLRPALIEIKRRDPVNADNGGHDDERRNVDDDDGSSDYDESYDYDESFDDDESNDDGHDNDGNNWTGR